MLNPAAPHVAYMLSCSYKNAQFFLDGSGFQGEPENRGLSLDASCLLKELYISIAV